MLLRKVKVARGLERHGDWCGKSSRPADIFGGDAGPIEPVQHAKHPQSPAIGTQKRHREHLADVVFRGALLVGVGDLADVVWTDDIRQIPDADQESAAKHNIRQVLTVPLLSSDGGALGMFGVLDGLDRAGISPEDIRRARALAAPVAVALEAARNLHLSEQHRRRAEDLMAMALELNSLLRLPDFVQSFTARAADMLGARSAALALAQRSQLEVVVLHSPEASPD